MKKSRINFNPAVLFFLLTFLLSDCSIDEIFSEKEKASFTLPDYENVKSWKIQVLNGETEESFSVEAENNEKPPEFSVEFEKNVPVSILAFPVFDESGTFPEDFFKPAGCVFPFYRKISFENGFEAQILFDFYEHQKKAGTDSRKMRSFAERFNWKKLHEERVRKASGLEFYNPWFCDREKIEGLISGGSFSVTYLDEAKCFSVEKEVILEELEKYVEEKNCSGDENESAASFCVTADEKPEIFPPYFPEADFIGESGKVFLPGSGAFSLIVKAYGNVFYVSGSVKSASKKSLALSFFTL